MKKIILASMSKRRSQILSSCGIKHRVLPSGVREIYDPRIPVSILVEANACAKSEKISFKLKSGLVIGADTLVMNGRTIIGKPASKNEAKKMLRSFSGRSIEVYTGLCIFDIERQRMASCFDKSEVIVKKMRNADIERFFPLLWPYDKAGGFSIEGVGSMIFDEIKGSYFNILGLPMIKLYELFARIGYDLIDFVQR